MNSRYFIIFALNIILILNVKAQDQSINESIRKLTELLPQINAPEGSPGIYCKTLLPAYYQGRNFQPIWQKKSQAERLITSIKLAEDEGLSPNDYHYEFLLSKMKNYELKDAELEVYLTDAFLLYASHLIGGKVNAQSLDPQWKATAKEVNLMALLDSAISNNNISETLLSLTPTYKTYTRLKKTLATYNVLAYDGGWSPIAAGETLKPGVTDPRIKSLRLRLGYSGDLSMKSSASELYDEELEQAVRKFQLRHGLEPDGEVGQNTLQVLNEPVEKRIEQLKINMERCRWLPLDLGNKHLLVNIANFELEVVDGGEVDLQMNVVVGKPYRKTPVFSSKMTYIVFNPYWTVPPTILEQDMLPALRKNPGYLKPLNIKVVSGFGASEKIIDPYSINWHNMTARNFPYMLRQDPGPNNALGVVKFIFPNTYNVYMHDTNHRELFSNTNLALSSGCIRLSKPLELAYYLLKKQEGYTKEKIDAIIAKEKNRTVVLADPINVHLLYWTAFVDEEGRLNFRKDIYDRDAAIQKALTAKPGHL